MSSNSLGIDIISDAIGVLGEGGHRSRTHENERNMKGKWKENERKMKGKWKEEVWDTWKVAWKWRDTWKRVTWKGRICNYGDES